MFGHIARMKDDVPANRILDVAIGVIPAIPPAPDWKRRKGRPNKRWLQDVQGDDTSPRQAWNNAEQRGHRGMESAQRASPPTRS